MFDQDRLRSYGQRILPLVLVLWLAALIPAAKKLIKFEWAPGAIGLTPANLPASGTSAGLGRSNEDSAHGGLLVVAIHPLCSCTRATLKELQASAANWKQPVHTTMLIYKARPQAKDTSVSADFDWHHAAYIRDAQQALHADVVVDEGGERAAQLGALTSGEVLYYSAPDKHGSRRLLFSGGVTAGRGMEGENGGIDALERAVQSNFGQELAAVHAPVYGCGLAALSNSNSGGPTR